MKCEICKNLISDKCKFCDFEYDETLFWCNDDDWDILNMNDDYEWSHLQIQYRLKAKNIECLYADIWYNNNVAIVLGAKANAIKVADALGVHEEVVYDAGELPLLVINLFEEKYLRGLLDD